MIVGQPLTVPNPVYTLDTTQPPPTGTPSQLTVFPPTVKIYSAAATAVPPPAIVAPFVGSRWDAIRGNLIAATDPRYAYVPFYRRENGSPVAQLIVVAVAVRNRTVYTSAADATDATTAVSVTTTSARPACRRRVRVRP